MVMVPRATSFFSRAFFPVMGTLCSLFCLMVPVRPIPIPDICCMRGKEVKRLSTYTWLPGTKAAFLVRSRTTFGPCPRWASSTLVFLPQ